MNKQEALLKVVQTHFDWNDLQGDNVQDIVKALEAAYDAGAMAQQAPLQPLQQATVNLARFNTVITLHVENSKVCINIFDDSGREEWMLDPRSIAVPELMAMHFENLRVGVFQEVMRLLGSYNNNTILWDK